MCNYPSLAGIQKPVYLLLNAASQLTHCLAGFQNAEISLFRAVLVCMRLLDPCLSCSCLFSRGLPDKHEHAECTELLAGCLVLGVLCGRRRKISSTHSSFYVSFPSRARAYASVCVRAFVSILLHAGVRQCHCVCVPMYCSCCGMPEEVALFHKSESGLVRDGVSKRYEFADRVCMRTPHENACKILMVIITPQVYPPAHGKQPPLAGG